MSCPIPCRTWHWPQAQVLSHPFHPVLLCLTFAHKTCGPRPVFTLRCSTAEWRVNTNLISHRLWAQIGWDQSHRDRSDRARRPWAQKNWAWQESWDRSVSITGRVYEKLQISKDIVDNYRSMFESRISPGRNEKLPYSENFRISSWFYCMEGHAKKCVERYCELANKTIQQLYKVSTPCIDDHHFKEEDMKSVGELSNTCSHFVLKCLYLARIGRPDILWSVNKLARSITKWTKACDKRLIRLISYIHHTCEYKQYCHVGNTAKQSRLGLFYDSDL